MSDEIPPPFGADPGPKKDSKVPAKKTGPTDGALMGLGAQLTGTVLLCVLLGWWLDRQFGTSPWILVGLSVLGLAAGLYQFVKGSGR